MGLRAISAYFHARALDKIFKILNAFAIWVILPVVVFISTARYNASQILGFGNALLLGFISVGVCFVSAVVFFHFTKDDRKTTIAVVLNSAFMNVTYLGFPAVYALLGTDPRYMVAAALFAMGAGTLHVIFGTVLASSAAKKRLTPRTVVITVVSFPAVFALIAALLFVAFNAPIPGIVVTTFDTYLAMPFFALMLMLVGYQIPLVNPRKYSRHLATVGTLRFVISPLVTYLAIVALGLNFTTDFAPKAALLLSAMPPAVFNVILAHNFKLDEKFYGAIVFYLTLISIFLVLPLVVAFMP
jgi:predicted permease